MITMKLLKFEIKKIFHQKTVFFALILLIANIIVCAKITAPTEEEVALRNGSDQLMQEFVKDPAAYRAKVNSLAREFADQLLDPNPSSAFFGIDPGGKNNLPSEISGSAVYSDLFLYARVLSAAGAQADFEKDINSLLTAARTNLEMFEKDGNESYNYKYQMKVIEVYENVLAKTKIGYENIRGWDTYFGYEALNIFIAASVIILIGTLFTGEKHTGMPKILRCSKNGGKSLALTKIMASLIVTITVVLVFSLSSFAVIGINQGYSSPLNAAQALQSLKHIPLIINVGTAFCLFLLLKLTAFIALCAGVLLISFLFYNYITVYATSAAFYALNIVFATYQYQNPINPLRFLNISSAADAVLLLARYRSVNLFGFVADINLVWLCISLLFAISVFTGIFITVSRGTGGVAFAPDGLLTMPKKRGDDKSVAVEKKKSSKPIFRFEAFKLFFVNKFLWVVLVAIVLRVFTAHLAFPVPKNESEAVYKEYCDYLYGEITDEKIEYIDKEHSFVVQTIDKFETMMVKRNTKQISEEEFSAYLEDYYYAVKHRTTIIKIDDNSLYLQKKLTNTNVAGWFFYDTGWNMLFTTGFDFILLLLILISASMSFPPEYSSGFISVLRLTKFGRKETFNAKFAVLLLNAAFCSLIFSVAELAFTFLRFGADGLAAPLLSLSLFSKYNGQLTLGGFMLVSSFLRLYGALFFAAVSGAVFQLLKKQIPGIALCFSLSALPLLLRNIGISFLYVIDISALLDTADLFLSSFSLKFLEGFGFAAVFVLASAAVLLILMRSSSRNYSRENKIER
ncbi:MAG: hypothetical protein PHV95_07160 [Eubacteriales bacterium]|nr:hypothetical protein [Eubacteriales bacterium]